MPWWRRKCGPAARSAKAAKETADLIDGSIQEIEEGVKVSQQTVEALAEIGGNVSETRNLVGDITDASQSRPKPLQKLTKAYRKSMRNPGQCRQRREAAALSQEMSAQARVLEDMVAWFRVSEASPHRDAEPVQSPPD